MVHWISRKPDPEDIEIDAYWDALVLLESGRPVPIPPPPTELTSLIHQLTLGQGSSFDLPNAGDPMLLRVLKRQQEITTMNQAMSLNTAIPTSAPIPIESRREKWTSLGLIAAVFTLAIGLVALNLRGEEPSNTPGGIVLTGEATPESATPSATDYLNQGATLLWRTESGAEAMIYPTDITIGPDGNVWVAEAGRNQIRVYSPDGELIEISGETGSGPGQFNFNRDPDALDGSIGSLAFGPDGSLYVLDSGNFRVQKFHADRTLLLQFGSRGGGPGQFEEPSAIAIAPDGTVYIQDYRRDLIQAFDEDGNFLRRVGKRGNGAVEFWDTGWLSADTDGNLWSADWGNNRVMNFTPDGSLLSGWGKPGSEPGHFTEVIDVVSDGKGHVFTAEMGPHRVQVFNETGQVMSVIQDLDGEGYMVPMGVAVDGSGNLYIADFGRGLILKYAIDFTEMSQAEEVIGAIDPADTGFPSGIGDAEAGTADFLWTTADSGEPNGPSISVSVAPDGNIWMADAGSDSFRIYSPTGQYIEEWGLAGSGPGEFVFTENRFAIDYYQRSGQVLFMSDGSFFVADPGNDRVQAFAADRTYVTEFGAGPEAGATVASIGRLMDMGEGRIGVTDFPATEGSTVELVVFNVDGSFVERRKLLGIYPILVDGEIGYWTLESNVGAGIRKYSWDGEVLVYLDVKTIGDRVVGVATDIAIDADGNIFTADSWAQVVSAFGPDGTYLMSWTGEDSSVGAMSAPIEVELASDGTVIVVDYGSHNISAYRVAIP